MTSSPTDDRLRERFARSVARYGAGPAAVDAAYDDLAARYREPHRGHHDLDHVREVVAVVDRLGDDDVVVLAAFFHDAVYDPRSSTNEADSAALAREVLGELRVAGEVIDDVARLVTATADYSTVATDERLSVLADADLAVLGASPERYQRYVDGVRHEYGFVDDEGWRVGRAAVLRSLLDRPLLYVHAHELEQSARANLIAELARLAPP